MKKGRYTEEQIIGVLKQREAGGVFVTWLKGVQASKEKSTLHYGALSHPFGRELGKAGDSL
jgi:hypothetical protein